MWWQLHYFRLFIQYLAGFPRISYFFWLQYPYKVLFFLPGFIVVQTFQNSICFHYILALFLLFLFRLDSPRVKPEPPVNESLTDLPGSFSLPLSRHIHPHNPADPREPASNRPTSDPCLICCFSSSSPSQIPPGRGQRESFILPSCFISSLLRKTWKIWSDGKCCSYRPCPCFFFYFYCRLVFFSNFSASVYSEFFTYYK